MSVSKLIGAFEEEFRVPQRTSALKKKKRECSKITSARKNERARKKTSALKNVSVLKKA
jgi:hypothetical protein